jgi:hypothetical protein
MFIFKPVFSLRYPYVKLEKYKPFKKKIIYKPYDMGDNVVNDEALRELVKKNKELLLNNQVPIAKIRFVFQPSFTYDIDNDVINPKYQVMLPLDEKSGLFVNNAAIVEIGKPANLMKVNVRNYRTDDNYAYLKSILKYSKNGLAVYIGTDNQINYFTGVADHVKFSVDCEVIRFANLDEEIETHNNQQI